MVDIGDEVQEYIGEIEEIPTIEEATTEVLTVEELLTVADIKEIEDSNKRNAIFITKRTASQLNIRLRNVRRHMINTDNKLYI